MNRNPWKLATIGLALVGTTALGSGLTAAYWPHAPAAQEPIRASRVSVAPRALAAPRLAPARATPAVAAAPAVPVRLVSTAVPADCDTGGERAMRIAKPGLIGGLLGAGLGAASGAIADGGKAAGKGALIGGIAGAALGGGYGAYKTKQECGTILGDSPAAVTAPATVGASPAAPDAAGGRAITVYDAR